MSAAKPAAGSPPPSRSPSPVAQQAGGLPPPQASAVSAFSSAGRRSPTLPASGAALGPMTGPLTSTPFAGMGAALTLPALPGAPAPLGGGRTTPPLVLFAPPPPPRSPSPAAAAPAPQTTVLNEASETMDPDVKKKLKYNACSVVGLIGTALGALVGAIFGAIYGAVVGKTKGAAAEGAKSFAGLFASIAGYYTGGIIVDGIVRLGSAIKAKYVAYRERKAQEAAAKAVAA